MHFVMEAKSFDAQSKAGKLVVVVGGTVNGETAKAYLQGEAAEAAQAAIWSATPLGMRPDQADMVISIDGVRRISKDGKPWIEAHSAIPLAGAALVLHRLGQQAADLLELFPELPDRVRALLNKVAPSSDVALADEAA